LFKILKLFIVQPSVEIGESSPDDSKSMWRVQNRRNTCFSKIAWVALLVFINLLKLKEASIYNN